MIWSSPIEIQWLAFTGFHPRFGVLPDMIALTGWLPILGLRQTEINAARELQRCISFGISPNCQSTCPSTDGVRRELTLLRSNRRKSRAERMTTTSTASDTFWWPWVIASLRYQIILGLLIRNPERPRIISRKLANSLINPAPSSMHPGAALTW